MVTKTLEGMPPLPVVSGALPATPGARILPAARSMKCNWRNCSTRRAPSARASRRHLDLAYSAGVGLVAHLGRQKH